MPGAKIFDVGLARVGKRFSTVEDAGVTTHVAGFKPDNCALSPFTLLAALPKAAWVGFKKLHASTKLNWLVGSFVMATDDGIVTVATSPTSTRSPSKLANQKSLSLRIGPPAVAPNCSMVAGVTAGGGGTPGVGTMALVK